ncbi:Serine/threonine-protein phosphatase 2A regulatory subunit A gamma isoform [Phytophthora citrophthora]|uniref:Serine/threonine-protein phosphatase 2A regulatory subunit A gamma isoform n=1 Tax=Phytophthora citrophthora TaxID=4793 RepID=A0AAD9GJ20_9STRA|nr:Serine/threonine-protein phosphatase 2A regulatory subunit A gamma isoform [Phytophthora citrophthora]
MEAKQDALVDVIRAIIGPHDVSRDRILALLAQANNDPNKAVDLYFQSEAANGAQFKVNDVEGSDEEDGEDMAWAETPALPRQAVAIDDDASSEWTPKAEELSGLLGGEVKRETILSLLSRTNNDLNKAVEIYFSENGADAEFDEGSDEEDENVAAAAKTPLPQTPKSEENGTEPPPSPSGSARTVAPPSGAAKTPQTPSQSSAALPQTPSALTSIESHQLTPLSSPAAKDSVATEEAKSADPEEKAQTEEELLNGPGTYEVVMSSSNFRWQIGNVFGRAVVQQVQPGGPAALAGIQKSDVLLSFRETVLNEENCAAVVQQLSKERVLVPSALRFRRASDAHPPQHSALKTNGVSAAVASTKSPERDSDGDVVMTSTDGDEVAKGPVDPKYGLQVLCQAVESMQDAVAGPSAVEFKVLVDLLLNSEFSLDRAVNTFLTEDRIVSDFRGIIGYDWDPEQPVSTVMGGNKTYAASIPAGPLGLTVENILERTIVVDIKSGGAAERANVKRSSWLVGLNDQQVTGLTHKETLRLIETATRPLQLQLVPVPPDDYKALRRQLSMNIRQQKTERPIPEQDRMSFRVFQMKIHQGVLAFPKLVTKALFQYLSTEEYHPPTMELQFPNPLDRLLPASEAWDAALLEDIENMEEERTGEMCAERRFLLNLFASIHDYDDKGESTVIRTIQFLGWLAVRTAKMQQFVDAKEPKSERVGKRHRYELLLAVVLHVLESLSIIENHATWDVMVNALKMLLLSLPAVDVDKLVVPMFARLSISSSPTARIVPVALLSMVYPHVHGDVRVQLRGMLDRMCNDDNPLVRRAVTSVIGDLAIAGGSAMASWTVQLLEKSTADSHDIVRIFAVKSCITLATTLRRLLLEDKSMSREEADQALRLLYCQMVPMVNTYTSDTSWQVRLETARTLPSFCRAFGADYTDVFVDHFVSMVGDPTVEVRRACAEGAFLLGEALRDIALQQTKALNQESSTAEENGDESNCVQPTENSEFVIAAQEKFVRSVLPATYSLSTDVSVAVKLSLAQSVGRSLQFIGSNYYDDLVPIFTQFLDESQDATVRASLLEEMARYCHSSSDTVTAMIFSAIQALRTSVQWRVRVKFVHCVAAWAERADGAPLPSDFADACLELLGDAVNEVREVVCEKLPSLGKSLGSEWVAEKCVPRVSVCLQSTFHGRLTGLLAVELLAPELQKMDKLRDVIETVLDQCTSKTANLRFRALRTLALIVPMLNEPTTTESTLEIVRPLARAESEADPDVREAAEATQAVLEAALN